MRNNKSGMTLVEILIATTIIVFATVAIIQFYLSSLSLLEINKEETFALAHLNSVIEAIKYTPFSDIVVSFPPDQEDGTVSNNYATLVGGYVLRDEHIVVSYVNPGGDPLEIKITVNWQDKRGLDRTKYLVTKRTR